MICVGAGAIGAGALNAGAGGVSYPAQIAAAGAQRGWNAGALSLAAPANLAQPASNTALSGQLDLPAGWAYSPTFGIINTAPDAVLDGWDTNGRPIFLMAHARPSVLRSRVTNSGHIQRGYGLSIGGSGVNIAGPITITEVEVDGLGEGGGPCVFTGSIAGTTLTVTSVLFGTLTVDTYIDAPGVTGGTRITALGTGAGGVGTYALSASLTVASVEMTTRPYIGCCIQEHASTNHSGIVITRCILHGQYDDTIQLNSGGAIVQDSRLGIGGWNSKLAHWDAVQMQGGSAIDTDDPIIIRGNWIDGTPGLPAGAVRGRTYGRTSAGTIANRPGGAHYSENVVIGADVLDVDGAAWLNTLACNPGVDGMEFRNNALGVSAGGSVMHPNSRAGVAVWTDNFDTDESTPTPVAFPGLSAAQWLREDGTFWQREEGPLTYFWLKEAV